MEIHVIDMTGEKPKESTITMPKLPEWSMAREIGYEPKTTFWQDFCIADLYGPEAIIDTFKRAFREWHKNLEYLTELALVLNHKGMFFYREEEPEGCPLNMISKLYFMMWEQVDDYAREHLNEEDYAYYFRITD